MGYGGWNISMTHGEKVQIQHIFDRFSYFLGWFFNSE
jgi:hypothetical protein